VDDHGEGGGGGHDGAGMMRWLLTYADLITLLLAFFVILYAASRINTARFLVLSRALRIAFNGEPAVVKLGNAPPSQIIPKPLPTLQSLQQLQQEIQQIIERDQLQNEVSVATTPEGVVIVFLQPVLFNLGSAVLLPQGQKVLLDVAKVLDTVPNAIDVRGYTDDLPIDTAQYPSNWELSAARALTVLHFLIDRGGVSPTRLVATAYGQYHPFAANGPHGNPENRRVEIVILRQGE
jgi:chemotaxis protein MotB